eukprot:scaffold8326_cov277-Pinguiococcus_pyrenoidosus.AAC.1
MASFYCHDDHHIVATSWRLSPQENQMLCSIDRIGKGEFDFVVPQVKRVRSGRPRVGCDDEERHAAGRWRD